MASCKIVKLVKKVYRIFLLLAFLTLCACTLAAQSNSALSSTREGQLKNRQIKFTSYKLANGLRVLLAPDEAESGVAVNISFDVGSRKESSEQAGLANRSALSVRLICMVVRLVALIFQESICKDLAGKFIT